MATYAKAVDFLFAGIVDANGDPAVGYKVYFCDPGTTDEKDVYSARDKAGGAVSQPIILDANGSAEIYADGLYRIRIFDPNDVLYKDMDNMQFLDETYANVKVTDLDQDGHKEIHEDGGAEELALADMEGLLGTAQTPAAHQASHVSGSDKIPNASAGQKGLATPTQIQTLEAIDDTPKPQIADSQVFSLTLGVYQVPDTAGEGGDADHEARWNVYFPEAISKLSWKCYLKSDAGADTAYVKVRIDSTDIGSEQTHVGDTAFTKKGEDGAAVSSPEGDAGWHVLDIQIKNSNAATKTSVRSLTFYFHV